MKKKRSTMARGRGKPNAGRAALAFIETSDDALAGFLMLRNCRRTGLTAVAGSDSRPRAAHAFTDDAMTLLPLVASFQVGEDDEVPAGRFSATVAQLRGLRLDEDFRRRREAADEIERLRTLEEDVRTWRKKGR